LGRPFGMKPSTEPGHLLSTHWYQTCKI
jgi:hypothetical protein